MSEHNRKELPKLIKLIQKYFWKLVIVNAVVAVIAVGILLLLPEWYRSTAVVISEEQGNQLNVNSVALNSFGLSGGIFGQNVETQRYIRYLSSRTIADKVIDEFDLARVWKIDKKVKIYEKLRTDVSFVDNEDGSINITVVFKEDAQMASDMANFYVLELQNIIKKFENNYKSYVEDVYNKQYSKLYKIEEDFGAFQKRTGIYDLETQTGYTYQALTELEVQRMKIEVQRDILVSSSSIDDSRVKELNSQIENFTKKVNEYKSTNEFSNVPVDRLSDQGIEYLRKYRDVMVQEQIVQFLAVEYEQAKLSNQKEEIKLIVLDEAIPSDVKYKPQRASNLILVLMLSSILSLIAANIKETYFT